MARICVVDDNDLMRQSVVEALQREEHQIAAFSDATTALAELGQQNFDVIISDLKMPGMDGIEFLGRLRERQVDTPLILMTAFATVPTAVSAMKLGAFDYLQKPFEMDELVVTADRAIQVSRLRGENDALRQSISDWQPAARLVGDSPAMKRVAEQIERVAQSNATVLIQGESGTGKELAARLVHAKSPRVGSAMLCVNCAALSPALLESELFGHEKGAFTGADRLRKGRFELAHGGTLMLDEISEVSPTVQAKLLRVLQEQEYERVGSSQTRRVDVRVIATTNRDLRDWVARRRFREDLFFRVSVLPVEMPPLREHREDIPELASCFLERIARRDGREPLRLSARAIAALTGYHWPGNVRELENVCQRAAVLCNGPDLPASLVEPWLNGAAGTESPTVSRFRMGFLMEDMERDLIERTLKQFNGHRQKTARALGIGVRTLGMKLKKWREEAAPSGEGNVGAAVTLSAGESDAGGAATGRMEPTRRAG
ncbi:MAG: sigma-54-dependent Fis family transcriptional regulator [Phycisphaerae bacterium]|nr:sigma-54 dependent transcriptional regulator [Phycisphaerae bacterium]NUQ44962.1 sigma-54-dependent Fis family transcriptional regulator [Phycisphaerae bacterium]